MVGVDNNFLSLILHRAARAPNDPITKQPIERLRDRIEFLLDKLNEEDERIVIPAPVLAEFLILAADDGPEYLRALNHSKTMILAAFDERAAIELAAMDLTERARGDKRGGSSDPWQKIKIDRQIVAIAKVNSVRTLYVDDTNAEALARRMGMKAVSSWELCLPESDAPLFDNIPALEVTPAEEIRPQLPLEASNPERSQDSPAPLPEG